MLASKTGTKNSQLSLATVGLFCSNVSIFGTTPLLIVWCSFQCCRWSTEERPEV